MELADLVAYVMLVLLVGWIGIVLWATFRQIDVEARAPRKRHQASDERL